jgi:hypothetical protein
VSTLQQLLFARGAGSTSRTSSGDAFVSARELPSRSIGPRGRSYVPPAAGRRLPTVPAQHGAPPPRDRAWCKRNVSETGVRPECRPYARRWRSGSVACIRRSFRIFGVCVRADPDANARDRVSLSLPDHNGRPLVGSHATASRGGSVPSPLRDEDRPRRELSGSDANRRRRMAKVPFHTTRTCRVAEPTRTKGEQYVPSARG